MKNKALYFMILASISSLSACAKDEPSEDTENKKLSNKQESTNPEQTQPGIEGLARKSFQIEIDGDGTNDTVYFIDKKYLGALDLTGTTITQPFYFDGSPEKALDIQNGSKSAIVVNLSTNNQKYIIHDANPISILDTEAANDMLALSNQEYLTMEDAEPIDDLKGGVLVLPTEAGIDTYIYWNGDTFVHHETLEIP